MAVLLAYGGTNGPGLDPTVHITLVTDERHSFYNRLNLTRFLAEEVGRETLFDYTPAWYDEQHITVYAPRPA